MYKKFFKRICDFCLSLCALIVLLPFFIIFTVIVAIAMGGSPFFVQKRPGKKGKIFSLIKYRTMNNKRDKDGKLLPDKERLTKFGKVLRRLSIDELPELINILLGQMSFVGPRPLLVSYLPLYNEFQNRRHEVKPGLTGLAQVSGRNAISWDQKFNKDIEYVDNCSLLLDIKIMLKTVKKVLVSEGISQDGEATMEFFTGNNESDRIKCAVSNNDTQENIDIESKINNIIDNTDINNQEECDTAYANSVDMQESISKDNGNN